MARYFTSDLQFSQKNIIGYANRPYRSVEEMDEALIANAWDTVGPNDELIILGDLAMGQLEKSLQTAGRLPGNKTLLCGNHDRPFRFGPGPKRDEQIKRYEDVGFTVIVDPWVKDTIYGHDVLLSHFPYTGDSHGEDRYLDRRPPQQDTPLIHGHVHTAFARNGNQFNVGVDMNYFMPVSETAIAHWLDCLAAERAAA
tara:strand:+ start:52215 stop:52808 length:594 start_codon:yes stop_codon:yes gene_type:complete